MTSGAILATLFGDRNRPCNETENTMLDEIDPTIDETKLEESIGRHPEAVRELFGYDTDGDFVVDSGSAFRIDT